MKMKTKLYIGGAIAGVGLLWYLKHKATTAVTQAAEAVNPTNPNNVINSGFNSVYQDLTGSKGSLGTDLAAWMHGQDSGGAP